MARTTVTAKGTMIELIFFFVLTWLTYATTLIFLLPILLNVDLKEHFVFDIVANITDAVIYFNEIKKKL